MASKTVIGGSSVSASQLKEFFEQIAIGALNGEHIQALIEHRNSFADRAAENSFLKCISVAGMITIDSCDGSKTIANTDDVFRAYIDSDFKNWNLDKPGPATAETAVQVYETLKDATFIQLFCSLGADLDKLCLTQHQIITFCEDYTDWLRTDFHATFFLTKKDWDKSAKHDNIFVAFVRVRPTGLLYVDVNQFENSRRVWLIDNNYNRLVAPQLDSQKT